MLSHNRLRVAGSAAVLAVIAAATGCTSTSSSDGSTGSASQPLTAGQMLTAAVTKTQQVKTFSGQISLTGTGQDAMSMTGTIAEQVSPLLIQVDLSKLAAAGENIGQMDEVVNHQGLYLKAPALTQELGQALGGSSSKPWIEFSTADLGQSGLSGLLSAAEDTSPLSATQMLSGSTNTRKIGTSTLNGVQVTELQGSEPESAAVAKLPSSLRSSLGKELSSLDIGTIDFTVWVDGQDLVRKEVVTEKGSKESLTSTAVVTSVNQPANVTVPPASQVTQIPASALSGSGL